MPSALHYRREGCGPAMFLLHGFASSSAFWSALSHTLSSQYDVIAPDWPGFGTETAAPVLESVEDFAVAVLALADALGIEQFYVMGHSMSGFVVQELLCRHGHRLLGAVLYGAGLRVDSTRRFESLDDTLQRVREDGPDVTGARIVRQWFVDGCNRKAAEHVCVQAAQGMTAQGAVAALRAFFHADYTGRLQEVKTPVLVILGEGERSHPPASAVQLWAAFPDAHLAILPYCGHAAHLEQPELFERSLYAFLH